MKHLFYAFLTSTLFFFSNQIYSQSDQYYYSGGKQIELKTDLSVKILHFKESIPQQFKQIVLPNLNKIEIHDYQNRIILYFNTNLNYTYSVAEEANIDPELLKSEIFGSVLTDGFKLALTHNVVIQFGDGLDQTNAEVRNYLNTYGAKHIENDENQSLFEVQNPHDGLLLSNTLLEMGLANWALPDFYAEASMYNDPFFDQQFQMHNSGQSVAGVTGVNNIDVNGPQAWAINNSSASITVAVIDDGVEDHEDLNMSNGVSRVLPGFTPVTGGNGTPTFTGKHGIACTGIVAASHNSIGIKGMAPNVKIRSVNIFYGGETTQKIAQGITWAKNNGADVMSNSWGYTSCIVSFDNINNAIDDARNNGRNGKGCVIVFASGNGYKSCVDYPASLDEVLAVGAVTNQGNISNYSNQGSQLDVVAPSNAVYPQIGAGVRTIDRMGPSGYSFNDYTIGFGGTSAACPVVSGTAALVLSQNPDLTELQVRNIIKTTATDMGANGFDNTFGHGRVNAHAAVVQAGGENVDDEDEDEDDEENEDENNEDIVTCGTVITSFPYNESFESVNSMWNQSAADNLNWTRHSGSTPTAGTGPGSASDGSFYMFLESSAPNFPSKNAVLNSPCFDITSLDEPEVQFNYHMFGNSMGTLTVKVSTDGTNWTTLWSESGNNGNVWKDETLSLSDFSSANQLRIRFEGETGNSYNSDMAIDKVMIVNAGSEEDEEEETDNCPNIVNSFPYNEGFESGLGLWSHVSEDDMDWLRTTGNTPSVSTGPTSAAEGNFYMFVESTAPNFPAKKAIFESPCLNLSSLDNPEFAFNYNMYGNGMGTINVKGSNDGENWTTLWSQTGNQGPNWYSQSINLSEFSNETEYKIRIEGITGNNFYSDMAVDGIYVGNELETPPVNPDCEFTEQIFPYSESFESGIGTWTQNESDDAEWTRQSGSTPSAITGPSSASDGSYYLYLESSAPISTGDEAILTSPCLDLSTASSANLTFKYHMFGPSTGTILLEASSDGENWTGIWSASGNRGNVWRQRSVNLYSFLGSNEVKLRFTAIAGAGFTSDMAIDNINITATLEQANSSCPEIDFNDNDILSFGYEQDNGIHQILNNGSALKLTGNTWKAIDMDYEVGPNTMLEFEFKSNGNGEIQGIGLDYNLHENPTTTFRVNGSQDWGISNYDNYSGNGWQTFVIPAGQYFTGSFNKMVFVNDDDFNSGAWTEFRNVKLYESDECAGSAFISPAVDVMAIIGTEEDKQSNISLYPNPVFSDLTISLGESKNVEITIYDVAGKIVYQAKESGNSHRISASGFSSGVYSVAIKDENANVIHKKFVKAR